LQSAYEKYLPAVLNNKASVATPAPQKQVIAESRVEVTGDKAAKNAAETRVDTNVIDLKRLAGLK
jgi:hypothetical protein